MFSILKTFYLRRWFFFSTEETSQKTIFDAESLPESLLPPLTEQFSFDSFHHQQHKGGDHDHSASLSSSIRRTQSSLESLDLDGILRLAENLQESENDYEKNHIDTLSFEEESLHINGDSFQCECQHDLATTDWSYFSIDSSYVFCSCKIHHSDALSQVPCNLTSPLPNNHLPLNPITTLASSLSPKDLKARTQAISRKIAPISTLARSKARRSSVSPPKKGSMKVPVDNYFKNDELVESYFTTISSQCEQESPSSKSPRAETSQEKYEAFDFYVKGMSMMTEPLNPGCLPERRHSEGLEQLCDACSQFRTAFLPTYYRGFRGKAKHGRVKINPETSNPYNICLSCWEKVKNSHSGCRPWVHHELEKRSPGIIMKYKKALLSEGQNSPLYPEFEALFDEQLLRYISLKNFSSTATLQNLRMMTNMAMDGMRYKRLSSARSLGLQSDDDEEGQTI